MRVSVMNVRGVQKELSWVGVRGRGVWGLSTVRMWLCICSPSLLSQISPGRHPGDIIVIIIIILIIITSPPPSPSTALIKIGIKMIPGVGG